MKTIREWSWSSHWSAHSDDYNAIYLLHDPNQTKDFINTFEKVRKGYKRDRSINLPPLQKLSEGILYLMGRNEFQSTGSYFNIEEKLFHNFEYFRTTDRLENVAEIFTDSWKTYFEKWLLEDPIGTYRFLFRIPERNLEYFKFKIILAIGRLQKLESFWLSYISDKSLDYRDRFLAFIPLMKYVDNIPELLENYALELDTAIKNISVVNNLDRILYKMNTHDAFVELIDDFDASKLVLKNYRGRIRKLYDQCQIINQHNDKRSCKCEIHNIGKQVTQLYLTGAGIKTIAELNLRRFPDLEVLVLSHNNIKSIKQDDFKHNVKLKFIALDNNRITEIHDKAFSKLRLLSIIRLHDNNIKNLSPGIFDQNSNLDTWSIFNNPVSENKEKLFRIIVNEKMLRGMRLKHGSEFVNGMNVLGDYIKENFSINKNPFAAEITIGSEQVSSFSSFKKLMEITRSLKIILIVNDEIPLDYFNEISSSNLVLDVSNRTIPFYIRGEFNTLKIISSIEKTSPVLLDHVSSVEEFSVIKATYQNIEEVLLRLKNCRTISLYSHSVNSLSGEILSKERLESISIVKCQLQRITHSPSENPHLKEITFSNNELSEFHPDMELFPNLQKIELSQNKLEHFPKGIGKLRELKYLNLSNNQIREIPEEFYSLHSLKYANLINTECGLIDIKANKMKNLEHMYFGKKNKKSFELIMSEGGKQVIRLLNAFAKHNISQEEIDHIEEEWEYQIITLNGYVSNRTLEILGEYVEVARVTIQSADALRDNILDPFNKTINYLSIKSYPGEVYSTKLLSKSEKALEVMIESKELRKVDLDAFKGMKINDLVILSSNLDASIYSILDKLPDDMAIHIIGSKLPFRWNKSWLRFKQLVIDIEKPDHRNIKRLIPIINSEVDLLIFKEPHSLYCEKNQRRLTYFFK